MALIKCQTISGETIEVEEKALFPRPCAYALVVNNKNELLVEDPKDEGGKYWFLGGGLKNSENPKIGLKREVFEESGMNIKVGKLIAQLEYCYYHNKLKKYYRCKSKFFLCKPLGNTVPNFARQVKTKWLKITNLKSDDFHNLISGIMEKLREELGRA